MKITMCAYSCFMIYSMPWQKHENKWIKNNPIITQKIYIFWGGSPFFLSLPLKYWDS